MLQFLLMPMKEQPQEERFKGNLFHLKIYHKQRHNKRSEAKLMKECTCVLIETTSMGQLAIEMQ